MSGRHTLPVCRAPSGALQSCLTRMVLAPERFRGCCPFGASQVPRTPRTLPRRVDRRCQIYQRAGGWTNGSGHPACLAACGELVPGVLGDELVVGALAGQLGQLTLHLAPDPADGDAEDSLTALDEVYDLVGRGALVDRGAVAHQGDLGEV